MATFGTGPYPVNGIGPVTPVTPMTTAVGATAQPKCNIIYKDDMNAVLDHPTSPNEQLYFAESGRPVIWVRETDGNGRIKNPMKRLAFTVEEVPFGPEANFVTKDEYQKLFDLVSAMSGQINGMNSQIESLVSQLK